MIEAKGWVDNVVDLESARQRLRGNSSGSPAAASYIRRVGGAVIDSLPYAQVVPLMRTQLPPGSINELVAPEDMERQLDQSVIGAELRCLTAVKLYIERISSSKLIKNKQEPDDATTARDVTVIQEEDATVLQFGQPASPGAKRFEISTGHQSDDWPIDHKIIVAERDLAGQELEPRASGAPELLFELIQVYGELSHEGLRSLW
ncbi:hypothetical protein BH23PAT1_BH23PAT1_2650 [soil metagenome]